MQFTSDIEIIKSAILYGDIGDAMSLIDHRLEALRRYESDRNNDKKQKYAKFLKYLRDVFSGNISVDQFREIVESNAYDTWFSQDSSVVKQFLDSFCYFLRISMDRYDVKYPVYDEKRCNDA